MIARHFLDVRSLITDLGGPAAVAAAMGACRTAPYRWMRKGFLSSTKMAAMKDAFPEVAFDAYFNVKKDAPTHEYALGST